MKPAAHSCSVWSACRSRFTKLEPEKSAFESDYDTARRELLEYAMQIRKRSGQRVRVEGLVHKPELNGRLGTLCSRWVGMGRCAVQLDGEPAPMALKYEVVMDADDTDSDTDADADGVVSRAGLLSTLANVARCAPTCQLPRRLLSASAPTRPPDLALTAAGGRPPRLSLAGASARLFHADFHLRDAQVPGERTNGIGEENDFQDARLRDDARGHVARGAARRRSRDRGCGAPPRLRKRKCSQD